MYKIKDKKIKFFEYANTGDSISGTSPVKAYYGNGKSFWSYFRALSGKEYFSSDAVQEGQNAEFVINYNPDIKEKMFIEFSGSIYNIVHVDPFEGYKGDIKLTAKKTEGKL